MVSREKIKLSSVARRQLFEILDFFKQRNGSNEYGQKLYDKIFRRLMKVDDNLQLGELTDKNETRRLVVVNYSILYRFKDGEVEVLSIRDARRNSED